ncbi:hypothetical protein B566_EDAN011050 [Ephemera danica]|nr:hypothetical protein B566_EDAN011050 [Ephemera danica]
MVDLPQANESVAVLVEVQPESESGLVWTRALINDAYLLELKYLQYDQIYRVRVSIFGPHGRLFAPIIANGFHTLNSLHYKPKMEESATISNLLIQGDQLYANVTWKPAEDKICCHKIRRFYDKSKPPKSTRICEGSTSTQLNVTEALGKKMSIDVLSATSGTRGESDHISLSYDIPHCPVFGQNKTHHSALCGKFLCEILLINNFYSA